MTRLAELVADPETDMDAVVACVSHDPGMTLGLLRRANSAQYGGRGQVGDVRSAVVRLGFGVVLEAAVRVGSRNVLDRSIPQYGFSERQFWRHCCAAAHAAEALRRSAGVPIAAVVATAALLHDIGKLAIAQHISERQEELLESAHALVGIMTAERDLFGLDHAEVGGLMAKRWRLPETIVQAITFHHDPGLVTDPITDVVHVADQIALMVCSDPDSGWQMTVETGSLERLGIDADDLGSLAEVSRGLLELTETRPS
ncbi:MAG: HDOD domain-containing protein [Planctomycetes bacterium]|nr:HDOD domain-containing protein [Planctomycetota bacterium]